MGAVAPYAAMSVNPVAAKGFEAAADAYVRGRPSYPAEAISWLQEQCALGPGATVVDVAAGTGKFTEALVELGGTVIAVEPVAAMRSALTDVFPGVTALEGSADALPLAAASADTITVAQAFHWFAGEPALAEFARVLRDDGRLVLVWNTRDQSQPLWREVSRIIGSLQRDTPRHGSGQWRQAMSDTSWFRPLAEARFENRQLVDRAGFVDRVGSTSFIAALAPAPRAEVLGEIAALVADDPEPIALEHVTEVYVFGRQV